MEEDMPNKDANIIIEVIDFISFKWYRAKSCLKYISSYNTGFLRQLVTLF